MMTENLNFSRKNFDLILLENAKFKQELNQANERYNYLLEQIKLMNQRQFGKKSEQAKSLPQLEIFFDEEELPAIEAEEEPTETITYTRQKKTVGRRIDTSKLPREQVIHDLSAEEKKCAACGTELEKIGEDTSEQLEYIPAKLKVIEHIRPKYTCRCCETIKSATKPESPLPKSMAGASLITDVIIKKYEHHLPWYRQSKIFAQEGIDIPANTIGNWFMQAGEILEPLEKVLWEQLTKTKVLQADETTVKVLADNIKGYMWAYHSCEPTNRFVLFEYNDSRSGEVVNNTLENYQGLLQSDGYSGYNNLRNKAGVINLGCWAHCRRKFVEVIKLTNKTGKAHEIVSLIAKLYQFEETARTEHLTFTARQELRQQKAKPILEKIHDSLTKAKPPPKSAIYKAITYALNQWDYLIRYLDHGEAEIDNNWVENQIRPFALGRKNWMFVGNKEAAATAALFYSLIQTCKLNNIEARKYLIYVLNQAGKMRRRETDPKILLPQFIDKNLLD
jgi:Transposase and inactivated derivatives